MILPNRADNSHERSELTKYQQSKTNPTLRHLIHFLNPYNF